MEKLITVHGFFSRYTNGEKKDILGNSKEAFVFTLHKGEHQAILGENGTGKSTLLALLRGEAYLDSGIITWYTKNGPETSNLDGKACTALVSPSQHENYLKQEWNILGQELLLTGFYDTFLLYQEPSQEQVLQVTELIEEWGIKHLCNQKVHTLSQGQLRILLLARAIIQCSQKEKTVLLLDEYYDGLDRHTIAFANSILEKVANKYTIVMTSHRMETIPTFIKNLFLLKEGILTPYLSSNKEEIYTELPPHTILNTINSFSQEKLIQVINTDIYIEGSHILHNINWTWKQGEHWHIYGENGSGKSTFFRLLAGEEYPAFEGSIVRNLPKQGGLVWDLKSIKAGIQLVSNKIQTLYTYNLTGLKFVLSGFENIIGIYRKYTEEEINKAKYWIDIFQVTHCIHKEIFSLSTGQLRRLVLARALISSPDILLLDEPFSGLDTKGRKESMNLLQDLLIHNQDIHLAIISHHKEDILPLINKKAEMKKGRLSIIT